MQARPDRGRTSRADAGDVFEPPVVRGEFQRFERVDVKFFMDAFGEAVAQARDDGEQLDRVSGAAQSFELRPVPGADHLDDRRCDPPPDVRQAVEAVDAFAIDEFDDRCRGEPADGIGGLAIGGDAIRIGALGGEEIGCLAQPVRVIECLAGI